MSKKLAKLVFEQAAKRASVPAVIHPIFAGKHLAPEHPIFVTNKEENWLRSQTDGKSDTTQWNGIQSFVDPSGAYGGDMSGTQTSSNNNGSGTQAHSGATNSSGGGTGNSGSASVGAHTTGSGGGYGVGGGGGSLGGGNSNSGGGGDHSYGPTGGLGSNYSPNSAFSSGGGNVFTGSHIASNPTFADHAWNSIMGSDPGINSMARVGERMTVNDVPNIPGGATAIHIAAPASADPASLAAQYANYQRPPGYVAPSADVTNRDRLDGASQNTASSMGTDKAWSDDGSLVATSLAFGDPTASAPATTYSGPKGTTQLNNAAYAPRGGYTTDAAYGTDQNSLVHAANMAGIDPHDLATVMNYETIGTMNPAIKGGLNGDYTGLIQFGPTERAKYGVNANSSFNDQAIAAARFLTARGVQPGMGLTDVYGAVNAGYANPKYYTRSDGRGNIYDKVSEMQNDGWTQRANGWLGPVQQGTASTAQVPTSVMAGLAVNAQATPASYNSQSPNLAGFNRDPATLIQSIPTPMATTSTYQSPAGAQTAMQGGNGMVGYGGEGYTASDPISVNQIALGGSPQLAGFATPAATADTGGGLYGGSDPTTLGGLGPNQTVNVPAQVATSIPGAAGRLLSRIATPNNSPQTVASMQGLMNANAKSSGHIAEQTLHSGHTPRNPPKNGAAATPPVVPPPVAQQGPIGPAYSIATTHGNYIVDGYGHYFQIDANGSYVQVPAPQGTAAA